MSIDNEMTESGSHKAGATLHSVEDGVCFTSSTLQYKHVDL